MTRLRARAVWLKVHLYLALTLGAFVAVLGLTGSILVFNPQIDRLLNPALHPAASGAQPLSADAVVAAVERQLQQRVGLIRLPRADRAQYLVELFDPHIDDYRIVTVDPASGEILGNRIWGETFITFLFDVHTNLLIGDFGLTLVGWLGIVLMISVVTGLYLWWPRAGAIRQAFTFRRSRALLPLTFELHRITGAYLAVILFIVAAAGVSIALPGPFTALVDVFARVSGEPESVLSAPAPADTRPATLAQVQDAFRARAPGARIVSIGLPEDERDSYVVYYVDRLEPDNYYGRSAAWIDQYTARILRSYSYSELGGGDRFLALQLPLHSGEILGLPGQVLVCITGLATFLLYGTGLYLWWKRRRRSLPARNHTHELSA